MKISENGDHTFWRKNKPYFLWFGSMFDLKKIQPLDEEKPILDIWKWDEPTLYSEQLFNREKDLKKSYVAVYHLDNNKLVLLQPEWFSGIELIQNGDADKLIAWSNRPYAIEQMWLGGPENNDFYIVDVLTGNAGKDKNKLPFKSRNFA
ncbi:MAG: hypothetical protein MZV49_11345 [Rhodopseudomonas palustris]|nr:hypothetical protein [Rhodopseudomonas palustris]